MAEYSSALNKVMEVMFAPERLDKGFGRVIAEQGLRQLRAAETEKYPHVTFFFNGGREEPYQGEDRILVQSPKVATYDLQPAMSAAELAEKVVAAIDGGHLRRCRHELRQSRHGRPHRHARPGDRGGRGGR